MGRIEEKVTRNIGKENILKYDINEKVIYAPVDKRTNMTSDSKETTALHKSKYDK